MNDKLFSFLTVLDNHTQYCIRIDELPLKTAVEILNNILTVGEEHLEKQRCFHIPNQPSNQSMHACLHNIRFEMYARMFVEKWHDNTLFQNRKLKCQIEYQRGHNCTIKKVADKPPLSPIAYPKTPQTTDTGRIVAIDIFALYLQIYSQNMKRESYNLKQL